MHRRRERWIRTGGGAARPVVLLLHLPCVEAVRGAVQGEAGSVAAHLARNRLST